MSRVSNSSSHNARPNPASLVVRRVIKPPETPGTVLSCGFDTLDGGFYVEPRFRSSHFLQALAECKEAASDRGSPVR